MVSSEVGLNIYDNRVISKIALSLAFHFNNEPLLLILKVSLAYDHYIVTAGIFISYVFRKG